jgi:hypothetical protein
MFWRSLLLHFLGSRLGYLFTSYTLVLRRTGSSSVSLWQHQIASVYLDRQDIKNQGQNLLCQTIWRYQAKQHNGQYNMGSEMIFFTFSEFRGQHRYRRTNISSDVTEIEPRLKGTNPTITLQHTHLKLYITKAKEVTFGCKFIKTIMTTCHYHH